MTELPESTQWRDLFAIALKIRRREPWRKYKKTDIITLNLEEGQTVFCSILGAEDDYYGVTVYPDTESLKGFLKIREAGDDPSLDVILENQQCLTAYFGERDILSPGDHSAMEYGEYSPEPGPLNQLFFRTYTPGLAPWYITGSEADILIKSLTLLYAGLNTDKAKKLTPPWEKGESLCFTPDNLGCCYTAIVPLPHIDLEEPVYIIQDELFTARLKKLPRSTACIELAATYISSPIMDGGSPRPCFPRMAALADHDQGIIETHKIITQEQDLSQEIINILREYIVTSGRPRLLIIRKNNIYNNICDFCKKINLPIEEREELEIVDDFLGLINGSDPEM